MQTAPGTLVNGNPTLTPSSAQAPKYVVAIAASAGGIPALRTLVPLLPRHLPVAYLLVLHRAMRARDLLPALLQRWTTMRVKLAAEGDRLESDTLYVAPAGFHLQVTGHRAVGLTDGRRISRVRSSADPMFESAATSFGANAVAVVLSGTGRNGAAGVRFVHDHGGVVIAQDRGTAMHFGMPAAAIETGCVDLVLPIEDIGTALGNILDRSLHPSSAR
jgi:two-component system chemotaxis response regulator CheB